MESWRGTKSVNNSSKNISGQIRWSLFQLVLFITMFVLSMIGIYCLMQKKSTKINTFFHKGQRPFSARSLWLHDKK
jgi:hypothetical protein